MKHFLDHRCDTRNFCVIFSKLQYHKDYSDFIRDSNKCSLWNDVFLHTFFFENAETILFSLVPPYPAFLWETKRFFLHQIGTPFPPSLARHTDRRATELSNVCGKEEEKEERMGAVAAVGQMSHTQSAVYLGAAVVMGMVG